MYSVPPGYERQFHFIAQWEAKLEVLLAAKGKIDRSVRERVRLDFINMPIPPRALADDVHALTEHASAVLRRYGLD